MFGKSPDMTGTTPFVWKACIFPATVQKMPKMLVLCWECAQYSVIILRYVLSAKAACLRLRSLGEFSSFFAQRKFDILVFCGLPTDSPVHFFEYNMRQEMGQTVAQSCCFDALCLD